jgi:hypothetical protein
LNQEWTRYSGFIGGVDNSGKNINNKFPPGTAGVKLLFLFNYGSSYTSGSYIADVQFWPIDGDILMTDQSTGVRRRILLIDGELKVES